MTTRHSYDSRPLTVQSHINATPSIPFPSVAAAPSSPIASSMGSAHQAMEASIVDLMQTVLEYQAERAQVKREAEERRKRLAAHQAQAAAQAAHLSEQAHLTRGVYGVHARTPSTIHHATSPHTPTPPVPVAEPVPSRAAIAATFASFLSHFHLLSHLVTQLPISSLERLIQFLQPTRIDQDHSSGDGSQSTATMTGTISYAFPLLDAQTQTQLMELLIKALLHLVYLREKIEQDQLDADEYRQHQNRVDLAANGLAGSHERKQQSHGEGEQPGPGEVASRSFNASSSNNHFSELTSLQTSPSASSICQLRLFRALRVYSGQYRLSYIIHRCVDYQNWLACAVAMESCVNASSRTTSDDPSILRSRSSVSAITLASGSVPDLNLAYVADAMECRLKHLEQRLEVWQEWKHRRSMEPQDQSACLPIARSSVPLLLTHQLPPLPPHVWLSFDEFAVESAHLFMQLVSTHLIRVATPSEQARLIALLMRGWRAWDLPSLILESIFLSHLASIADALSMLAFQKSTGPTASITPQQTSMSNSAEIISATSAGPSCAAVAAPIFSAKLYLALTHYRLSLLYRSGQPAASSLSLHPSTHSPASTANGPVPTIPQQQRLWTEVLTNLNRDLEHAASGSTNSSSSAIHMQTGPNAIIWKGLSTPLPIAVQIAASSAPGHQRSGSIQRQLSKTNGMANGTLGERQIVAFSCNHSYTQKEFSTTALPELFNSLLSLQPSIPITTKFLASEYGLLGERKLNDEDGDDEEDDVSPSSTRRRLVSVACPSCVYTTLAQMHARHEQLRQQTVAKVVHQPPSGRSVSMQTSSMTNTSYMTPSRSLTPTLAAPTDHANGTTFSFIQQTNAHGLAPPSPVSPLSGSPRSKLAVGLSMSGNVPKIQFGRVSVADLDNSS